MTASPGEARLIAKPKSDSLEHRLQSQTKNLRYTKYVCRFGNTKFQRTRWACKAVKWLTRERNETLLKLRPPTTYEIARGQAYRLGVSQYEWSNCAVPLINRENAHKPEDWDVTNYNDDVGPPYGAYGLGQALPKEKMAKYGKDYMTSAATQIRWFFYYCYGKYGSICAANSHQLRYGSY